MTDTSIQQTYVLRPSQSIAAQIMREQAAKSNSIKRASNQHLRMSFVGSPYFKIYESVKSPDGTYSDISPFSQEDILGLLDAKGQQVHHQFVAVDGEILEVLVGAAQSGFNTKQEGEASVRCRTTKAVYTDPLTDDVTTKYGDRPLDFFIYNLKDKKTGGYNPLLKEKGIQTYGRVDKKYLERLQQEENARSGNPDAPVEVSDSECIRDCATCISNGWNVVSVEKKDDQGRVTTIEDACKTKAELSFLVRRVAIKAGNALRWYNVEDLGVDGINRPFVVVLQDLNALDLGYVGTKDNDIRVNYAQNPWVPSDVKTAAQYIKRLFTSHPDCVGDVEIEGLNHNPSIVYGVPTVIYLAKTNKVANRNEYPLFSALYDRATSAKCGLARAVEAWKIYNLEKAIDDGLVIQDEPVMSSAPTPAPTPTYTPEPQTVEVAVAKAEPRQLSSSFSAPPTAEQNGSRPAMSNSTFFQSVRRAE